MASHHRLNLAEFFHRHEPPELHTPTDQYNPGVGGSSRRPTAHSAQVFATLPQSCFRVKHSSDILTDLADLVSSSWSDESLSRPIGTSWGYQAPG